MSAAAMPYLKIQKCWRHHKKLSWVRFMACVGAAFRSQNKVLKYALTLIQSALKICCISTCNNTQCLAIKDRLWSFPWYSVHFISWLKAHVFSILGLLSLTRPSTNWNKWQQKWHAYNILIPSSVCWLLFCRCVRIWSCSFGDTIMYAVR